MLPRNLSEEKKRKSKPKKKRKKWRGSGKSLTVNCWLCVCLWICVCARVSVCACVRWMNCCMSFCPCRLNYYELTWVGLGWREQQHLSSDVYCKALMWQNHSSLCSAPHCFTSDVSPSPYKPTDKFLSHFLLSFVLYISFCSATVFLYKEGSERGWL